MALKALALLLDPVSGQIESPLAMLRDRRKEEGPNRSISLTSILSTHTSLTSHFDPKQGQGVELAL
jgi:hypothetical protein